jgi:hypothetical protein
VGGTSFQGNDKYFTAIDRIKSGTVAQTKGTEQRTVLKLFHYIIPVPIANATNGRANAAVFGMLRCRFCTTAM